MSGSSTFIYIELTAISRVGYPVNAVCLEPFESVDISLMRLMHRKIYMCFLHASCLLCQLQLWLCYRYYNLCSRNTLLLPIQPSLDLFQPTLDNNRI